MSKIEWILLKSMSLNRKVKNFLDWTRLRFVFKISNATFRNLYNNIIIIFNCFSICLFVVYLNYLFECKSLFCLHSPNKHRKQGLNPRPLVCPYHYTTTLRLNQQKLLSNVAFHYKELTWRFVYCRFIFEVKQILEKFS